MECEFCHFLNHSNGKCSYTAYHGISLGLSILVRFYPVLSFTHYSHYPVGPSRLACPHTREGLDGGKMDLITIPSYGDRDRTLSNIYIWLKVPLYFMFIPFLLPRRKTFLNTVQILLPAFFMLLSCLMLERMNASLKNGILWSIPLFLLLRHKLRMLSIGLEPCSSMLQRNDMVLWQYSTFCKLPF